MHGHTQQESLKHFGLPKPEQNKKTNMMVALKGETPGQDPPSPPCFPNPFPLLLLPFSVVDILLTVARIPQRMFPSQQSMRADAVRGGVIMWHKGGGGGGRPGARGFRRRAGGSCSGRADAADAGVDGGSLEVSAGGRGYCRGFQWAGD